jgi:hypothetical protein
MKPLPIGLSTFRFLIEDNFVYVDKTGIIEPLVRQKGRYFLSRPRRFGKSLLVDTFKELFEGNEQLFRNLAIHDRWDWARKYPVIKIDWSSGTLTSRASLDKKTAHLLEENAFRIGIQIDRQDEISTLFEKLITQTAEKYDMPVVVLVDEYDKPLLDNLEEPEKAAEMREGLKNFYSALKKVDGILQFVFLTGVSKFSKVSIFSGINNLIDITLDEQYGAICGYTQQNLETDFAEHLTGVDWEEIRLWYNGYNFLGDAVYNPFDILLFIHENRKYRNFWFETGTPTFLVKLMQKNRYFLPDLEDIEMSDDQLGSFEVERIPPVVLLFQTGYLTIQDSFRKMGTIFYRLTVPNQEVRLALSNSLFSGYTEIQDRRSHFQTGTYDALQTADMQGLETTIRRMFAGIPWRNFTNTDLANYEGFYASVLYAFFVSITCTVIPEDITNHGQTDMTVRLANKIYVMEIKVIPGDPHKDDPSTPLEQIKGRNYAEKYLREPGARVFELGMVFSRQKRNLVQFAWDECQAT